MSALAGCAPVSEAGAVQYSAPPAQATTQRAQRAVYIPPPKPRVPRPSPTMHELDLVGLDQHQIESALGPPIEETQHSPAMEAIFHEGRCTLSVTLYPDVQTRIYHALAYKVASNADTDEERRFCSAVFDDRLHGKHATDTPDHGG